MSGFGKKYASKIMLVTGAAIALLGVVHVVVGLTLEVDRIARLGTVVLRQDYTVYFCLTGMFFFTLGIAQMMCYRALEAGAVLAWRISLLCATCSALIGLGGVALNPLSPPLVLLIAGAVGLATLVFSRGELRSASSSSHTAQLAEGCGSGDPS